MSISNRIQNRVNLIVMLVWGTNRRNLGKEKVVWGSLIAGIGIVLREWVERGVGGCIKRGNVLTLGK